MMRVVTVCVLLLCVFFDQVWFKLGLFKAVSIFMPVLNFISVSKEIRRVRVICCEDSSCFRWIEVGFRCLRRRGGKKEKNGEGGESNGCTVW